ncbi:transketolase C-terminal domain-containing protein [Streptomyces sp. DSM 44915]|uniref:Transketolase C-terminal domain-containing protein n=1 Tax=Streptomyces chisholmiae TaxID=3075540 RepID=A0ABU2JPD7_9ACTN|nr:transketolase C-terminal domain-containing protein [Streptomyces sp. DSM 44915]MDT0266586.1 transketolase C-terminal domain-containing protein [Streptomyces sp. DSM 44915]
MRVIERLNGALHELFATDERVLLLGEDVADPYGGAFGATRGLSDRFPDRVWSTPISEQATAGVAAGLALGGDRVVVEVMFGDFITLSFDPIVNFLSKCVTMYGRRTPMPVVVRCPVGGNRGYGPTHSQHPLKHFLGVPNLSLYELSALHDPAEQLRRALDSGEPAILFEDKVLYTRPVWSPAAEGGLFTAERLGGAGDWVRLHTGEEAPDWTVIAPGGLTPRVLPALREALVEEEVLGELLVPSRLFPLDVETVLDRVAAATRVLVVEEGPAGGGWGGEVARHLTERLWGRLRHPVRVLQPPCAVIPAAPHLERDVLLQESTVHRALLEAERV